jgi:transcriptional regulator with XRE-family HTH domain
MRTHIFRGDRLRQERERLGLAQQELSAQIGTGPNQVYRYEVGEAEPSPYQLARLAKMLGVTTDYLLGLTDTRTQALTASDLSEDELKFLAALESEELGPVLRRLLQSYADSELRPQEKQQARVARGDITADG